MANPKINVDAADASQVTSWDDQGASFKDGTKIGGDKIAQLLKHAEDSGFALYYPQDSPAAILFFQATRLGVRGILRKDPTMVLSAIPLFLDGATKVLGFTPVSGQGELPGFAVSGAADAGSSLSAVLTQHAEASEMNRVLFKIDTTALDTSTNTVRDAARFAAVCGDANDLGRGVASDAVRFIGESINKTAKFLESLSGSGLVFADHARAALSYYNDRFAKAQDTARKNRQTKEAATLVATEEVTTKARAEGRAQARAEFADLLGKTVKP